MTSGTDDECDFRLDPVKLAMEHKEFMNALEAGGRIPSKPQKTLPERPTIRSEFVKTRTGGRAGPYFNAYWRKGGKLNKKYLGRQLPPELQSIYNDQAERESRDTQDIAAATKTMF